MRALAVVLVAVLAGCATGPSTESADLVEMSAGAEPAAASDDAAATDGGAPGALLISDAAAGAPVRTASSGLPVVVDVVALDGGSVLGTADAWKRPGALLFPSYSDAPEPARAIVRITPQEVEPDPLSPGVADFVIGADFALDAENDGTEVDSGNNVLQRGLASDPSQFKIEVDSLRPRCRIQGPEGTVELKTEKRIQAEVWYRLRCSREGTTVRLALFRIGSSTPPTLVEEVQAESSTGDLQWSEGTPLSVGGKLAANGAVIRSQTDQFNGALAEPFLRIWN